ncbi:exodeoxyribonuclease V subunit beta [Buchnera aphidicola]|uniref:exodeoxyribonuclease V subunit beta n=1 Tax=Buchnera aphidicola TaxID=9 RepID=UPI00346390B5
MCKIKKKLDILNISLHGKKVIEASAGTGKTFTIIMLYLRLLLGIDNHTINTRTFSVKEILIVTFTKNMQEELRNRIKKNIYNFRIACIKKDSKNTFFKELISKITNFNYTNMLLLKAEHQIDQAAIFTIHGFCNHILSIHQYSSNIYLSRKILENTYPLYFQATCDFWRKKSFSLSITISKIISQYWKNPESLLKDILTILKISPKIIKPILKEAKTITEYHEELIKIINNFKKIWLTEKGKIVPLIIHSDINKRIYHKTNLLKWIKKITIWANENTENYFIPKELNYFKQSFLYEKTKTGTIPKYILFDKIDFFLKTKFSLKEIFLFHALTDIPKILKKEKEKQRYLEFDDLLIFLSNSLKKNNLSQIICKKYPVTFIDEFQDTSKLQYSIFKKIYMKENSYLLILIGDPKQSIYSFRGANIFTYLQSKNEIKEHYFLDTNWRASNDMNHSINLLFTQHKNPFYLSQIRFQPTYSGKKDIKFTINGNNQPALRFFMKQGRNICIDEYQQWIANKCAQSIAEWLEKGRNGKAIIKKENKTVSLQAKDITILVRNKNESEIIKKALSDVNINSYYYSDKKNIYNTIEAKELLWILQSILYPHKEKLLKKAMFTNILQYNINEIENVNKEYDFWSSLIKKFNKYKIIWEKKGIFNMIKKIFTNHIKRNNTYTNSQSNIFILLQLAELLQEKSRNITEHNSLIFWLKNKILYSNDNLKKKYIKPFYDKNSIKIVTFYKSKGLEYNITWIPFSINFFKSKYILYHNKKTLQTIFDLNNNEQKEKKAKIEYLSEDIRLLYVALTRSILHCSIGIAPVIKNKKKEKDFTDLHKSALGYIIQSDKIYNSEELLIILKKISSNKCIELILNFKENKKFKIIEKKHKNTLSVQINKNINHHWCITSYSALKKKQISKKEKNIISGEFLIKNKNVIKNKEYNIHNFPKGKIYGTFLHNILKKQNFKKIDLIWLKTELRKNNLSDKWLSMLSEWISNISKTPLINNEFYLSKLNMQKYIKELEFYLSIKNTITDTKINKLMKFYDSISKSSPNLKFNSITGILTGSIDFVFCWKKKYYFIDYKTNWLGSSYHFYDSKKIKYHMIKNRYDLQYQLYSLALHRYLQQKIKNYQFNLHFGGIFFWFLRAIDNNNKNKGIFYTLPKKIFIEKLDQIF